MERRAHKTALDRLKQSWWFAWLAALFLLLTQIGRAIDGLERLQIFVGLKPDALATPISSAGELTRSLSELAWDRLFWARAYVARVQRGASSDEIDNAWHSYIGASEAWNKDYMVFLVATDAFYGNERADLLEQRVQRALQKLGEALISVRYPSERVDFCEVGRKIDEANRELYFFVRDLPAPGLPQVPCVAADTSQ